MDIAWKSEKSKSLKGETRYAILYFLIIDEIIAEYFDINLAFEISFAKFLNSLFIALSS